MNINPSMGKSLSGIALCLILGTLALNPVHAKILTTPDGGRYVGDVVNGIPNGEGIFAYSDGAKYVGEWKDGLFHGQGSLTEPDGAQYVGEFKDDKFWNGKEFDEDFNLSATYLEGAKNLE